MSVLRFTASGDLKLDKNVKYVRASINISWNDESALWGTALKSLSFNDDNNTVQWSTTQDSGNASRNFKISGSTTSATEVSVTYQSQNTPLSLDKKNDTKLEFRDGEGTDANATVTLSIDEVVYFTPAENPPPPGGQPPPPPTGPTSCPAPTDWVDILPACGRPPSGLSSSDGLQISKSGQNQITLNLKNYVNKLVTLKITHERDPGSAWTQSFDFNIPNCSDISPNTGGTPYAKAGYSNSNIAGVNTFYVYNVDGGDYNYVFNHSSNPGPRPLRTNYNLICIPQCSLDAEGVETCVTVCTCEPYEETYGGSWPHCPTGVAVSKNGGSRVQWQFEDGGGGDYNDQKVTIEVVSVRNAISSTGPICTSALKSSVWISDGSDLAANGNCISDYKDHSNKIRFRIPSLKTSKTTFTSPVCYSSFRGVAGAAAPGEDQGASSSEYSILHIFNRDFKNTESLVSGSGLIVTPQSEGDVYIGTLPNPSLNTTSRKHYLVQFTDGTTVSAGAGNIDVTIGQNLTADGLVSPIIVSKKEQVSTSSLRVWFYINLQQNECSTEDVIHVFNDDTNTTDDGLSDLVFPGVTIVPQQLTDPGNETVGFETLDAINKKHYLLTFTDSTIVNSDASNINVIINQNKTASNITAKIGISKKQRVDDKNVRVWLTAYYTTRPVGKELDNTFVRDWSVNRSRVEDFSGNVFVRNWNLKKIV